MVTRMPKQDKRSRTNYVRRGFGVILFLFPFALIACSLEGKPFFVHKGDALMLGPPLCEGLMGVALLLSGLNLYLAFIRPALFRNRPDYRFVSGVPMVGTLSALVGTIVGWGIKIPCLLGLATLFLDPGGLPWFIIGTWPDASLWDE
jgi:hypothetical protein